MQTRDQKYATDVYEKVSNLLTNKTKEEYRSYGVMAHKLPILIYKAGLAQALAFVEARGKVSQKWLLDDLAGTIGVQLPEQAQGNKQAEQTPGKILVNQARTAELSEYMLLTQQILDALLWYKRFAQSLLDVDASAQAEEETSNG